MHAREPSLLPEVMASAQRNSPPDRQRLISEVRTPAQEVTLPKRHPRDTPSATALLPLLRTAAPATTRVLELLGGAAKNTDSSSFYRDGPSSRNTPFKLVEQGPCPSL